MYLPTSGQHLDNILPAQYLFSHVKADCTLQ